MTEEQRMQIVSLREDGNGYKKIAQALSLSDSTGTWSCERRHCNGENYTDYTQFTNTDAEEKGCSVCPRFIGNGDAPSFPVGTDQLLQFTDSEES